MTAATRDWWMWLLQSGNDPVVPARVGTLRLGLPYVWDRESLPDPRWGLIGLHAQHRRDDREMFAAFVDYFRQWHPRDIETQERLPELGLMGSMVVATINTWYRGSLQMMFTPPIYKFCDLNKEFPELDGLEYHLMAPPYDFWVQPEVFHATNEVLQGSPTYPSNRPGHVAGPRALTARRGQPEYAAMFEFVSVALDAWIENYERTWATKPDPRFAFTWAEERARRYGEEAS